MDKSILKSIVVLYVEDEVDVCTLTAGILDKFVSKVLVAANGLEGLELFKQHNDKNSDLEKIDLVVTDINMPKMDGLEMIEEIHKLDSTIPSIVTTAHNDADFLKKAINLRVKGYVSKPLNLHDLIDSIMVAAEPLVLRNKLMEARENLESQVEEKTLELRSILDSQENMILVLNEQIVSSANKTLLDFFNIDSIDLFNTGDRCICDLFIEDEDYFSAKDENHWIEAISLLENIKRVVKLKNKDNITRIFQVNIKSFFHITKHYVVSFTDITDLKEYTSKLQYQAAHDHLTNLYNRQKLNDEFSQEIQREQRYNNGLSLIMLDIDDFKSINDTYGHDVGDKVLVDISNILLKSVRMTDLVSRWGGEEFMILLPNTPDSSQVAEQIRANIERYKFKSVPKQITVSIGTSVFRKDIDTKDTIIKNVDIALYDAKQTGKNKVVNYMESEDK